MSGVGIWSVDDVCKWLESVGFGEFSDSFRENDICGDALLDLTHDLLKELNVTAVGKRIKLLKAIAALHEPSAAPQTSAPAGGADVKTSPPLAAHAGADASAAAGASNEQADEPTSSVLHATLGVDVADASVMRWSHVEATLAEALSVVQAAMPDAAAPASAAPEPAADAAAVANVENAADKSYAEEVAVEAPTAAPADECAPIASEAPTAPEPAVTVVLDEGERHAATAESDVELDSAAAAADVVAAPSAPQQLKREDVAQSAPEVDRAAAPPQPVKSDALPRARLPPPPPAPARPANVLIPSRDVSPARTPPDVSPPPPQAGGGAGPTLHGRPLPRPPPPVPAPQPAPQADPQPPAVSPTPPAVSPAPPAAFPTDVFSDDDSEDDYEGPQEASAEAAKAAAVAAVEGAVPKEGPTLMRSSDNRPITCSAVKDYRSDAVDVRKGDLFVVFEMGDEEWLVKAIGKRANPVSVPRDCLQLDGTVFNKVQEQYGRKVFSDNDAVAATAGGTGSKLTLRKRPLIKVAARSIAEPAMSGWLYKTGEFGISKSVWRRRWVIMKNYVVYYYKTPEDSEALGKIPLPGYTVSAADDASLNRRNFMFKVAHANSRTYVFAADTQEEMDRWLVALGRATVLEDPSK